MKKLLFLHINKVFVFLVFFLLLNGSANAQFADSLALFVVANSATPNAAELAIVDRLTNMEFDVFVIAQADVSDAETVGASLVLISATVSSGTTATNMPGLRDMPIPLINWEPALYDHIGHSPGDGGEFGTTDIEILLADHPLAAGLPAGPVTITTISKQVSYGVPQGDVAIIAVNPNNPDQAVLFGYEKGAAMATGTAPARRVGTFLLNDVADSMTEEGWLLFDASVIWAMGFDNSTGVREWGRRIPTGFTLQNNYPNPFNPSTNIGFSIPTQAKVRISVWNALGEKVATLLDEIRPAGEHVVSFNASNIPTGLYFYRLDAGAYTVTKKMLLLK